MSISDFVENREKALKSTDNDIKKTQKRLKDLLEEPLVIEFLTEEEQLKDLEKMKKKTEKNYQLEYQEMCEHPLFSLINVVDDNNSKEDIYCAVCGKKMNIPIEQRNEVKSELFSEKSLLARYRGISEETNLPVLLPITDSVYKANKLIEIIRTRYYKFYKMKMNKMEDGSLPKDYNIDEEFFMSMCFGSYQQFLYESDSKVLSKSK